MGQPAAAIGDLAAHGGTVAIGSTNVFIGGRPAARLGDSVACSVHGTGVIAKGSATVFINGQPAARMGDVTGCLVPGLPATLGAPPIVSAGSLDPSQGNKTRAQNDEDGADTVAHAEHIKTDADHDGKYDTHDMNIQGYRTRAQRTFDLENNNAVVLEGAFDMARVDTRHAEPTGIMGTSANSVEASMYRGTVTMSRGDKKSAVQDPDYSVVVQGDVLKAKAEHDAVIISDGRGRYGLLGKVEASAQAASADVTILTTIAEYGGYDVKIKSKRGVAGGAVGGGVGAWGYYDANESRAHLGANALLKVLIGFELEWDVSAGKKPTVGTVPGMGASGVPGTIVTGNPVVLIG